MCALPKGVLQSLDFTVNRVLMKRFKSSNIAAIEQCTYFFHMNSYQQFQLLCNHLHAVKVLLYAESVGVATSGNVTKMAVKLFDSPFPKTPSYTQSARRVSVNCTSEISHLYSLRDF